VKCNFTKLIRWIFVCLELW